MLRVKWCTVWIVIQIIWLRVNWGISNHKSPHGEFTYTDHVVGVWADLGTPHPRALLPDHAQPHALLGVQTALFV